MKITKKKIEQEVGIAISEESFNYALKYAKQKQEFSFKRENNPAIMQDWYLEQLTEECVRNLVFSKFTISLCQALNDMEKEHPAKCQSALNSQPYCSMDR